MSFPELSIVIPTLNEERLLPALLESIQVQTLEAEVIVADAHSTDRTREIAVSAGARVVEGGLPSVGRNAGAEAAMGNWILFLDADVLLPDRELLKRMLREAQQRSFDCATADIVPLSKRRYDRFSFWVYNRYVRAWGSRHAHAPGFFILVKRTFHKKIEVFNEAVIFCEDHEYAQRAAKTGQFGFLNSVKIPTSVRRFDKDGRLRIAWKFLIAELHLLTKGPIYDDRFHYRFDYGDNKRKK